MKPRSVAIPQEKFLSKKTNLWIGMKNLRLTKFVRNDVTGSTPAAVNKILWQEPRQRAHKRSNHEPRRLPVHRHKEIDVSCSTNKMGNSIDFTCTSQILPSGDPAKCDYLFDPASHATPATPPHLKANLHRFPPPKITPHVRRDEFDTWVRLELYEPIFSPCKYTAKKYWQNVIKNQSLTDQIRTSG